MRKYIPIGITIVTWIIVLVYMLKVLKEPVHRNLMFDNASAAIIVFAYLSFWTSIINGVIIGLCLKKSKEIKIPVTIHGIFTILITIAAIFFHFETLSYLLPYMIIGGVTGGLMVGIALKIKILRRYLRKYINKIIRTLSH